MPRKKPLLINPVLNQYVYDCLLTATHHERLNLNGKYLRAAKNSKTARTFVANCTDEEKAILLSKLGKSFAWVINIDKKGVQQLMEENVFGQSEMVERAIKERFIAISDKQILQYINLMAANTHSETWMLNREFLALGFRVKEWRKQYNNTTVTEVKAASLITKDYCKNIIFTLLMGDKTEEISGVHRYSFLILVYMCSRQSEFISLSDIKLFFSKIHKNFKTVRGITQLLEVKYIEKSYLTKDVEYRVTGLGVDAIMRFQKRILNAENF